MKIAAESAKPKPTRLPRDIVKFMRRVAALPPGQHVIILTVGGDGLQSWQVAEIGHAEGPGGRIWR